MLSLYSFFVSCAGILLRIIALFNPKIKLFVQGRRGVFQELEKKISPTDEIIWFHAASLGEYEQGVPVMEAIKMQYPKHKILISFFSPSGFEVRKNNPLADITVYLPLDTIKNAKTFMEKAHPKMVFFIKYEYWPNYLNQLKKEKIQTFLISGVFRENQVFFKSYGTFYRKALKTFDHFFVQNDKAKQLLKTIGFSNVTVSGDTRFDRVSAILKQNNTLDFIEEFKGNAITIVVGSSWPKDEEVLLHYINTSKNIKWIIAPHNIKKEQIANLKASLTKTVITYSEKDNKNANQYDVFLIDAVGFLTKIYSYADIAYVGGGFGNPGVHNVLEPATFGIPIIIGPNYTHFEEAIALVNQGACTAIANKNELEDTFNNLINNPDIRYEKGHIANTFVQMNKGATQTILKHLSNLD